MDIKPNHTIYVNNLNEKVKKNELKSSLHSIFTQFGDIIQVLSFRKDGMRGQAHVVFREISSASNALRALQGFSFYGKPMRIQYAREDSDVIAKAKGTYMEKRPKTVNKKLIKNNHGKNTMTNDDKKLVNDIEMEEEGPGTPHNILIASNLPDSVELESLQTIFQQFPGLREVRLIPNNKGIAFIEFENEEYAKPALLALNMFRITPDRQMNVKYANK